MAVQHLKKQPQPLESLRPDLPPALCRIVHQMLAKDPARRFVTARELLRELRRVQVEHFGDDWPEDLPAWDSLAAELLPDPRMAATQELAGLMKTIAESQPSRRGRLLVAAGLVVASLAGGLGAWYTVAPSTLLADATSAEQLRSPTVLDPSQQWYLASQMSTEAGWQSVIDHFPERTTFVHRAEEQLALIYLRKDYFNRAMAIFEKLAKQDDPGFRAFGLAGKCGILSIRHENKESNAVFGQLLPIRDKLTSRPMAELVDHAVKKNRAVLDPETAQQWDKWFKERFPDRDNG